MDFITPCLNQVGGTTIGSNASGGVIIETADGLIIVYPDGSQYRVNEDGTLTKIQ